ncbi:MAG: right-handed parallel beta-helix repeat-containing protein, partial [Lentisphaerae bacterium]|nr:right-handed parallel beta-helix repeat-containing protein [Lentisphaerota bacterium]
MTTFFRLPFCIALLLAASAEARAATYYVSPSGNDANNGASWKLAKQTIQAGVNIAANGDTVLVTAGAYLLTSQISISQGVTVRSVNGAQVTTINGGGVTRCAYLHTNAVLDGFTVTNGYVTGADYGGGVFINGGTIQNCTISGNLADGNDSDGYGGGVFLYSGGTIQNCTISGNYAGGSFFPVLGGSFFPGYGGGVYLYAGGTIQNCTISGNSAGGPFNNGYGGGVHLYSGGTIQNCTINDNTAGGYFGFDFLAPSDGYGAGVYLHTDGMIQNCTISGNGAWKSGGGISVNGGTVRNCTISGNGAWNSGGGLIIGGGTVQACTISGNDAGYFGAGVCVNGGTVRNCAISGNMVGGDDFGDGGGVFVWDGIVQNCTISGNVAETGYGGVTAVGGTVRNCIVYYNHTSDNYNGDVSGDISYSCIGTNIGGVGNITNEPQFVSLGTGDRADPVPVDFRLQPTSPCINTGTNQPWMTNAGDLDGKPRIICGVVDMGAYEGFNANAFLIRNPAILSNRCDYGFTATGQTIEIWNAGTGAMEYVLSPNVNWLSLSPASGLSTGETVSVSVNYETMGLTPGSYTGIVTIIAAASNSPQFVTVYLWVDKLDQTIAFPAISSQAVTGRVGLAATASSGLPVSFAVASGPGTIADGTNLTFTGTGMVWVVARQGGDAIYNPAPSVTNSVIVTNSYTITASADAGGSISPAGTVTLTYGESQSFAILAAAGYRIATVTVDGVSVGSLSSYTFHNVMADHTIAATFTTNQLPVIVVQASPTNGPAPLRVEFDLSGSFDSDGRIVLYELDKDGDGVFEIRSTDSRFVVEYMEPGIFAAVARVTDNDGGSSSATVVITATGQSPVADIRATPEEGQAPLAVRFDGTGSTASAGRSLVAYEWDFDGDGVYDRLSTTGVVSWTYRSAGTYTVALRVTDNVGVQDTATTVVNVSPSATPGPTVTLSATPTNGCLPLTTVFTAILDDGRACTNFWWDFDGDGNYDLKTATGTATNIYTAAGTYQARVMVVDETGLSGSAAIEIHVSEPVGELKVWISTPRSGNSISGTDVTLMGHAAPASLVASAQFQYKFSSSDTWSDLGSLFEPAPLAYKMTWDVSGLTQTNYDLRLKATDEAGNVAYSDVIQVSVTGFSRRQPGDVEEGTENMNGARVADQNVQGYHYKLETFSRDETAEVSVYDGTVVEVPMGAVESDFTVRLELVGTNSHAVNGSAAGKRNIHRNRAVSIEGDPELFKPISFEIPYEDANNDGLVDGTRVSESALSACWFDETDGTWKRCLSAEVYLNRNTVKGTAYRLAEFGLFGAQGTTVAGDYDGDG